MMDTVETSLHIIFLIIVQESIHSDYIINVYIIFQETCMLDAKPISALRVCNLKQEMLSNVYKTTTYPPAPFPHSNEKHELYTIEARKKNFKFCMLRMCEKKKIDSHHIN